MAEAGAGLIVMASERGGHEGVAPVETVLEYLAESLTLAAAEAGIATDRIVVDPGIGFFRRRGHALARVGLPGAGRAARAAGARSAGLRRGLAEVVHRRLSPGADDPADRLPGSLAAATAAVLGGAHVIRAHDVAETVQAVRVAEAIRARGDRP